MKKILSLAFSAALVSPLALAVNTPDTVGNVTYFGNIVANSPMWQWTVNDYPGGRLDAKPSQAITVDGLTTYPLQGAAFIAVSGFLPAMSTSSGAVLTNSFGFADKTQFTDSQGYPPSDVSNSNKGAVTFKISAQGTNSTGNPIQGKLVLNATEVRGYRNAYTTSTTKHAEFRIFGKTTMTPIVAGGSCFIGIGAYSSTSAALSGTPLAPVNGETSTTAWNAFMAALTSAETTGNAGSFASIAADAGGDARARSSGNCGDPTPWWDKWPNSNYDTFYGDAAHVVELKPVSLEFSEPLSGAWTSTLTVTAYQM